MGRNPGWQEQVRARGLCHLCMKSMKDDDPRQTHYECYKYKVANLTVREIRELVNARPRTSSNR